MWCSISGPRTCPPPNETWYYAGKEEGGPDRKGTKQRFKSPSTNWQVSVSVFLLLCDTVGRVTNARTTAVNSGLITEQRTEGRRHPADMDIWTNQGCFNVVCVSCSCCWHCENTPTVGLICVMDPHHYSTTHQVWPRRVYQLGNLTSTLHHWGINYTYCRSTLRVSFTVIVWYRVKHLTVSNQFLSA